MANSKSKVTFQGSQGDQLAGLLELPSVPPRAYVLFAHCFTCGKDIAAASRISRELVNHGFAVFRFDFTGLGSSDGDFANTNFTSNVQDLVAAAKHLEQHYQAPSLLIGHSLGGTAVLNAASRLSGIHGVVTIGSPAEAEHVLHQFECCIDTIERDGEAEVSLAGRKFNIKKQFIDDLRENTGQHIAALKSALLIMHSPTDNIVSINNAEKIYVAAKHPKSFVSLDHADHLLSNRQDVKYVAATIAAWALRYIPEAESSTEKTPTVDRGHVLVAEKDKVFTQDVFTARHHWLADEPTAVGGADLGPDPYAHLLAALGTCTSMTMRMYANRKKWPVDKVSVDLSHTREHGEDCAACDEQHPQIDVINRTISIEGNLTDEQRNRMLEIADRCPVHKTLHGKIDIRTDQMTED
jgi:putative redox protein